MDFPELVKHLCNHPGMHVSPANLDTVRAYLNGFDAALGRAPLAGFREWLIVRGNGGDNLTWDGLVMLQFPGLAERAENDPLDEQACICALGCILAEFLTYRDEHGLTKIFYDYGKWLLRQRWYTGSLRQKRSE